ncbi:hypothetical protein KOW79_020047 [Hemibagrus wyckioides]|uniref:Uncharacterized protein n=1 Tax=Hemibagrus wyckioides TaxID=337641 RepID=A0A9D3S9M0_9TELE|nr:hypothetical protein KOW79_020047 [Hemibagrus wyckioides]
MVINGLASKGIVFRGRQRRRETAGAAELAEDHSLKVDLLIHLVNFNHAWALSRAATAAIPLGDGVTAYRITPPFIKEPVTHYSLRSSWSH